MVCFHFVFSFTGVVALPVLNSLHTPAESKEKYIPIPANPAETLVLLERQKIASLLLLTSYFSLESRETCSAELLFCFCLYTGDKKAHEEAGTKMTFISALFLMTLCTVLPCKRSHAAFWRAQTQLFLSQRLWEYRRSIQTARAWLRPAMGRAAGAPGAKPSKGQLDEGPGCQQRAGPGHALPSGEERVLRLLWPRGWHQRGSSATWAHCYIVWIQQGANAGVADSKQGNCV